MSAMQLDTIVCMDALELCHAAADAGIQVDMILCDLPYGTTACSWDTVIPFAPMWEAFKRLIKPRGAIVLTASQPFTSALVMSNPAWYRHEWTWEKEQGTNPFAASIAPMKVHEQALVFGDGGVAYYPQFGKGKPYAGFSSDTATIGEVYNSAKSVHKANTGTRFPRSVIKFNSEDGLHPTQKPVDLFRYLIRTYTQPGELVFDCCVGSGTTAIAARQEGRHWLCGDSSAEYVRVAQERLAAPYTPDMFVMAEAAVSE